MKHTVLYKYLNTVYSYMHYFHTNMLNNKLTEKEQKKKE